MRRKRAHSRRDRAYHILQDRLTKADAPARDDLYTRAWLFIANLRARRFLGLADADPQEPDADED